MLVLNVTDNLGKVMEVGIYHYSSSIFCPVVQRKVELTDRCKTSSSLNNFIWPICHVIQNYIAFSLKKKFTAIILGFISSTCTAYFASYLRLESLDINRGHNFYNIWTKYFREAFCTWTHKCTFYRWVDADLTHQIMKYMDERESITINFNIDLNWRQC